MTVVAEQEPATNDQEVLTKTFHVLVLEDGGKPPTKLNSTPYSAAQVAAVLGALPSASFLLLEAGEQSRPLGQPEAAESDTMAPRLAMDRDALWHVYAMRAAGAEIEPVTIEGPITAAMVGYLVELLEDVPVCYVRPAATCDERWQS